MIQLFWFLSDSVDVILLLSTLQCFGVGFFLLLWFYLIYLCLSRINGKGAKRMLPCFPPWAVRVLSTVPDCFIFLQIFLSTVYRFLSLFQTGVPRVAPC